MTLMPAFDIADGTVKGPPFHTDVVRIETTLACCLASIQRLLRHRFPSTLLLTNVVDHLLGKGRLM